MDVFKIGDLVAIKHPAAIGIYIKTGIVVKKTELNIVVQWLTYDKKFFMEKEDNIFAELNKNYLLSKQSYQHSKGDTILCLLNSN